VIRRNADIDPGELAEPEHPGFPVLLEVTEDDRTRTAELLAGIPGLVLLRSRQI